MKRGRIQIWHQGLRPEWLLWTEKLNTRRAHLCNGDTMDMHSCSSDTWYDLLSVPLNGSYKFYIQGTSSHKDIEQTEEHDSAQELPQWYYSDYGNKDQGNCSRLHFFPFPSSCISPFPSHSPFLSLSHSLFLLIMLKGKALTGCSKKQKLTKIEWTLKDTDSVLASEWQERHLDEV